MFVAYKSEVNHLYGWNFATTEHQNKFVDYEVTTGSVRGLISLVRADASEHDCYIFAKDSTEGQEIIQTEEAEAEVDKAVERVFQYVNDSGKIYVKTAIKKVIEVRMIAKIDAEMDKEEFQVNLPFVNYKDEHIFKPEGHQHHGLEADYEKFKAENEIELN